MPKKNPEETARDNRANQLNPYHPEYYRSRGAPPDDASKLAETAREKEVEATKKQEVQK